MKTPITYYGGKQRMLSHILPLIPKHKVYVEPFVGGGAVFWAKEPSETEVINDTNKEVINFYIVAKNNFRKLEKEIKATLHSRELWRQAKVVYQHPDMFSPLKRAWAFWTLANQSFSAIIGNTWATARSSEVEHSLNNKRNRFTDGYKKRLEKVQIECYDALRIIRNKDSENTFFYCDPPYFNSDMGHYEGYNEQHFRELLEALAHIKGKFLLSSYPSEILFEFVKKQGWKTISVEKKIAVTKLTSKTKIEVLTGNYEI